MKMARIYEKQGRLKKAIESHKRAIRTNHLLEESYQKLITLYANKRMYNEALKTYRECKKALKKGLKAKPDPMTNALYEKVIQQLNRT